MKFIELPMIICIKSGKSIGLSHYVMDIPENSEHVETLKPLIDEKTITINVEEVVCEKKGHFYVIKLICSVEKIESFIISLDYTIPFQTFMKINSFFGKNCKLSNLDSDKAIILIKEITDSFDPLINVALNNETK